MNSEIKYKVSFVLEVKDVNKKELIMFVQGKYSIDKSNSSGLGIILEGELVQTVFNTPSSLKFAFYDNTYVTVTDEYKVLSDMDEEDFMKQFMCSPALYFTKEQVDTLQSSEVSDGVMYSFDVKNDFLEYSASAIEDGDYKGYFDNLLGDDLYSFSGMKMPQRELTKYSDISGKFVISPEGMILSRDFSYIITAYDSVPYFPAHQASEKEYERVFSVSLKYNYKAFGDEVAVDISEFMADDSESEEK